MPYACQDMDCWCQEPFCSSLPRTTRRMLSVSFWFLPMAGIVYFRLPPILPGFLWASTVENQVTSTTNIPPVPLIEKALPVAAGTGRAASFVAAPRMAYLPKGSAVAMGFTDVIFLLSLFGAASVSVEPLPTTLAVKKEAGLESQGADEVGGAGTVEWPAGLTSLTCEKQCIVCIHRF